ncbi:Trm112 family protein [Gammaproteobacteria bacterium]|nr:Trm112 family protein [Gammaproteobacteria bacterium]
MTINARLLSILRCPTSGLAMRELSDQELRKLQQAIDQNQITDSPTAALESPLSAALITENSSTIYPVVDGVPVMLEDWALVNAHLPEPIGT